MQMVIKNYISEDSIIDAFQIFKTNAVFYKKNEHF